MSIRPLTIDLILQTDLCCLLTVGLSPPLILNTIQVLLYSLAYSSLFLPYRYSNALLYRHSDYLFRVILYNTIETIVCFVSGQFVKERNSFKVIAKTVAFVSMRLLAHPMGAVAIDLLKSVLLGFTFYAPFGTCQPFLKLFSRLPFGLLGFVFYAPFGMCQPFLKLSFLASFPTGKYCMDNQYYTKVVSVAANPGTMTAWSFYR